MNHIYRKLKEYGKSNIYPCHMPGHKRRRLGEMPEEIFEIDITEVEGFDNLHEAGGIIAGIQKKASGLYGARESFCLVGGSSCGVQAAIGACVSRGGKLLLARGSHRSAYYGAYMRNASLAYLYPKWNEELGVAEAVSPEEVARGLEENPDAEAVLIVSPTYEGRVADVASIAALVHERGIPLIVDEAHGAHLGFHPAWHESSSRLGADLVIHSTHKTLPAPTQTALLHVNGGLVSCDRLRRFLKICQTSSPSYILLAGIEDCLDIVERGGERLFGELESSWSRMLGELSACKGLVFPDRRDRAQDIGKLIISTAKIGLSGWQLYDMLLEKYQIQPEMAGESYVLAMMTIGDSQEGFRRLTDALLELDQKAWDASAEYRTGPPDGDGPFKGGAFSRKEALSSLYQIFSPPAAGLSLSEAWEREGELRALAECAGAVSAEFVSLYPPGIPLLVPGEQIEESLVYRLGRLAETGVRVHGLDRISEKEYGMRVL